MKNVCINVTYIMIFDDDLDIRDWTDNMLISFFANSLSVMNFSTKSYQQAKSFKNVHNLFQPKGGEIQLHPPDYFRLEQLQEEFNFCDDTDIANNKRFQLLELRDGEVAEFKNYKLVPAVEKEIPRDTFTVSFLLCQHKQK